MPINVGSITYETKEIPKPRNHPFNSALTLTMEAFAERGISIGSKAGIISVFEDSNEYAKYKESMFGDIANEDAKATMGELLDRDRSIVCHGEDITAEDGSVGNVTTFAYLNGPVIRAIWARCIVPALMRVVALKQPTYTLTFDIPYIVDGATRKDLPYSMVDDAEPVIGLRRLAPAGIHPQASKTTDGFTKITFGSGKQSFSDNFLDICLDSSVRQKYDGRAIDRRICVRNITYKDKAGTTQTFPAKVQPSSKTGKAGDLLFNTDIVLDPDDADNPAALTVIIDLGTGRMRAMTTDANILSFEIEAFLSPEDNRTPVQLKQEQHSLEVMIGAGQHVMINTPVELLQEYPTSHQGSDYVVAMTDIASETYAGVMNVEMLQFYKNELKGSAAAAYIPQNVLRGMNIPNAEFDIRVAHGENPASYVDVMLKKCVSFYINTIRQASRIEDGYWCMVGHANNMMHVPDFKYEGFAQLNGDADTNRDDVFGFKVGYTFGFSTNIINGKVRCIYTPEIQQDTGILGFFTSVDDKRPTALYHPFSYTVSRGYQNPHNSVVPSIMITKRHTFQSFLPMNFNLKITGNDGTQFTKPKTAATPTTP